MVEVCCGVVSRADSTVDSTTGDSFEKNSRAARRRRMEIRRCRFVAGVDIPGQSPEVGRKRQRIELAPRLFPVVEIQKRSEYVDEVGDESTLRSSLLDFGISEEASPRDQSLPSDSNKCPKYSVMSICGRRRDMEDAFSVHPDLFNCRTQKAARYHFFGVFDGHGCSHVAVSCKERMHEIMMEELDRADMTPLSPIHQWRSLLERSFERMDGEAAAWRGGPDIPACRCEFQTPMSEHVGSTAVVALVSSEHIVVANCGDSRAVLCRSGAPVPLSTDHKPDRPDELQRIEDAGGRVIYWDGARVLGVLAMSRAIGDNYLKPFVISEPEVTVTERTEGDECLILASDGLWDVVSNETACEIVKMCLRGSGPVEDAGQEGSNKACADAATLLTKLALARARHNADNVTVVVVDLRRRS
ncbi:hypothetical protein HPP92_018047 [Vanilla planifolia]|uniref:protein-serine/threonine phosphatase n=1 Tax=Vanilla planifolia TaxID=51239 RepID=A0A835QEV3_VANPL|nr:hypothetical protein HPP92_018047 [Vanilla planifolia]